MKRGIIIAGGLAAVVVVVMIAAVKQRDMSAPPPPVPEPVVREQPAVPADNAGIAPAVAEHTPSAVTTPQLAKVVDRSLPFDERVRGLAGGEIPEVKNERDLETLAQLLGDPTEGDTVRNEIANLLFRSGYASLDACLVRIVENPAEKERFRSWAVQHLGNLLLDDKRPGDRRVLADRLRALLTDRHIKVRREALLALARHDDATALEKVREVLFDTGPGADEMRDLAIRLAQDKKMREHIPLIRPYARSTNEIIRIAAIVALSQWGDEFSRTAFEEAAQSDSVRLQRCGKAALTKLDAP